MIVRLSGGDKHVRSTMQAFKSLPAPVRGKDRDYMRACTLQSCSWSGEIALRLTAVWFLYK